MLLLSLSWRFVLLSHSLLSSHGFIGILNLVRFAVPRNAMNEEFIDYTVAAIVELYRNRHLLPKVVISRGAELHLRHFQVCCAEGVCCIQGFCCITG